MSLPIPAVPTNPDAPVFVMCPTQPADGPDAWPRPQPVPATLAIYGYCIGAEADPRLYGHPDLVY